ncbi:MAG TPA: hypothetical protein EYP23_04670 [Thermoplasmata archaeon]|nr:hypothetical protein [Thermoplasmata archaeon]
MGDSKGVVTSDRVGAFADNRHFSYDGGETMEKRFIYILSNGWSYYSSFRDDSVYVVQRMKDWASQYVKKKVDSFYGDRYTGSMTS